MGCKGCEQELIQTYTSLSEANGKTYLKYYQNDNLMIASEEDFDTLIEIGKVEKDQEYVEI